MCRATRRIRQCRDGASPFFTHSTGFDGPTWGGGLTYADAARAVLGPAADGYLARLGGCLVDQPQGTIFVGAELVAWRAAASGRSGTGEHGGRAAVTPASSWAPAYRWLIIATSSLPV